MSNASMRRIQHDLNELRNMDENINLEVEDLKHITCFVDGPRDTIYEDGCWKITIEFPDKYPYKSPSIGFLDKIYHPNIDFQSGSICLNALNEEWRPIYTIKHILETFIPQLLTYPNPEDPLNINAAKLYSESIEEFNSIVKRTMTKYNTFKKKSIDN